jgi:hypothetical protein
MILFSFFKIVVKMVQVRKVSGFRFRFQVSGFRFQVSGFRFQVSGFRFQVSGLEKAFSFQLLAISTSVFNLGLFQAKSSGFQVFFMLAADS